MSAPVSTGNAAPTTRVWDLPVRLFHWLLVAMLAGAYATTQGGAGWMIWHARIGYGVLGLLIFRCMWGFWGSRHARFADFIRGPGAVFRYARGLLRGRPAPHLGHNPLGGWMVVALLMLVGITAASGLFATDGIFTDGPLYSSVSERAGRLLTRVHHVGFDLLWVAALVHVSAVLSYLVVFRENLILPMFTGQKPGQEHGGGGRVSRWRAWWLALLAGGAVWWLVR